MEDPELVHIKTKDGLCLPGLLYKAPKSKKVAIFLHGNGSSSVFYYRDKGVKRAEALKNKGISFLLFNNRGAHYIKGLRIGKRGKKRKEYFGMAYERIKDCIKDIDAVISYLGKIGYKEFYLIGESTGANKICVYNYYKPKNRVSKYVLLSSGGDTGIYYSILGRKKFFELLNKSKEKIKKRKAKELIPELLPDFIFSYKGFYDIANPDGDYNTFPFLEEMKSIKLSKKKLFRHFNSIKKPTLAVYGEKDEYAYGKVNEMVGILKKQKPGFDYKIIKGAGHSFSEKQKELSKVVADWLSK